MTKLVALLLSVLLLAGACSTDEPYATEVGGYWESLTVGEATAFCLGMADAGGGFQAIGILKQGDDSKAIDLLGGGIVEDSHEARVQIGAQFDKLAAQHCPN